MERTEALIKSLLICLFALSLVYSAERAEFILLYKAQSASLLNRFQQKLTVDEQNPFKGCVPLQLVNKNETLGDEITTAHRVLFRGQTYFLVSDKLPEIISKSVAEVDTIQISSSNTAFLSENPDGTGNRQPLIEGEEYVRLFEYKGHVYLFEVKKGIKAGWSSPKSSTWKKTQKSSEEKSATVVRLSSLEQNRISELIENANKAYEEHFDHFNKQTGKRLIVPFWKCSSSETEYRCLFNGNKKIFESLMSSTEVLVHKITNVLLGRPFSIELIEQSIVISPKVMESVK